MPSTSPPPPDPDASAPPPPPPAITTTTFSEGGGVVYPAPCAQLCAAGMTLRDCFATAALQGIASTGAGAGRPADNLAEMSYQFADAMLTVRTTGKEGAA